MLIVVPIITAGLWWLLGHTRFGISVRASASNSDLARLTGISPKLVSTAIWTIAGFLSAVSIILYATEQGSSDLVTIGPETLLLGLSAALIGGMKSFPQAVAGAIGIGILYQVLVFNFPNTVGLVQFVVLILVLFLVARMSRRDDTGAESFSFAPRVPAVPERLREIWWVRRMPQLVAGLALLFADRAAADRHPVVPPADVRHGAGLRDLRRLGDGPHRVGRPAVVGADGVRGHRGPERGGLRARRDVRHRVEVDPAAAGQRAQGPVRAGDALGAVIACLVAVAVGFGALRVKGLLLGISTLAFAIAAQAYIFSRPIFTGSVDATTVEFPRGSLGPIDLSHLNRSYYYFTLAALVIVLLVVGHLRRGGIGRTIIGVRENETRGVRAHRLAAPVEAHRVRGRRGSSPGSAARSSVGSSSRSGSKNGSSASRTR